MLMAFVFLKPKVRSPPFSVIKGSLSLIFSKRGFVPLQMYLKSALQSPYQVAMLERCLVRALERPDLCTEEIKSTWPRLKNDQQLKLREEWSDRWHQRMLGSQGIVTGGPWAKRICKLADH